MDSIKLPQSAANLYYTFYSWLDVNNIKVDDSNYSTNFLPTYDLSPTSCVQAYLYLTDNVDFDSNSFDFTLSPYGENMFTYNTPLPFGVPTTESFVPGPVCASRLTPEIINSNLFAAVLNVAQDSSNPEESDWLFAYDFGFSIPTGATIDSLVVDIDWFHEYRVSPAEGVTAYINFVKITVNYTGGSQTSTGKFFKLFN